MIHDLRRALRSLRAHPHASAVAVLSIGIGLGVNLALFGILRGFYVQEREVPAAELLLWTAFVERGERGPDIVRPPAEFLSLLAGGSSWEAVGGWDALPGRTVIGGQARYATWVARTTPGFHALEGYRPAAGRFFEPGDTAVGARRVALLTHARATAAFGSPAAALGAPVEVSGTEHVVVGVLPPDALLGYDPGGHPVRVPLPLSGDRANVVVRLRPGVPPDRARAEIEALAARLPDPPSAVRVGGEKEVGTSLVGAAGESAPPLFLALAVLVVAAVNLTTVLLSRGLARQRALALCRLLGANRWRLLRPLVLESALTALASGAVAYMLAWTAFHWGLGFAAPSDQPRLSIPLLLYGTALMSLVVLVGGCWPALVSGRVDAAVLVRSGGDTVAGPGRGTGRALGLVLALQVAVALPVIVASGALAGEALEEAGRGVGYDPEGLIHVELPTSALGGAAPGSIVRRVAEHPAFEGAAGATVLPVTDRGRVEVDGGAARLPDETPPRALRIVTTSGRPLEVLGVPLVVGRAITTEEERLEAPVAVVGVTAARRLFGVEGRAAVGRRLRVRAGPDGSPEPWLTVVGVVGDVRDQPLFQSEAPPAVWTPAPVWGRAATTVWARPAGSDLVAGSRALAAAVSGVTGLPSPPVEVTASWVRRQTAGARVAAASSGGGALLAVLLCLLGLHGLTALVVVQRRRELGVRSALGAGTIRLVRTVLRRVLTPVAAGAVAGGVLWVVAGRVFHLSGGIDLGVWAAVGAFALLTAATALRPALRAAVASPARVLREE